MQKVNLAEKLGQFTDHWSPPIVAELNGRGTASKARRMFGTEHLGIFVISGLLLNLTPGQDTLYIVGRSISQGRQAGMLSVLGIVSGAIVHTLFAAFGFSAMLATSARAFLVVKLLGAAYLTYLGVKLLLERRAIIGEAASFNRESNWAIYRAGLLTNLLNPKVALFFMAFLPQFVAPTSDSQVLSFLFLGGLFIFNGTLWCLVLVWAASTISTRLRQQQSSNTILKRATGAIFVGLGVRLPLPSDVAYGRLQPTPFRLTGFSSEDKGHYGVRSRVLWMSSATDRMAPFDACLGRVPRL